MLSPRSYEAPTSLWEAVCERSAQSEHHELKQLIGADLIDQTLELRKEIRLLLELTLDLEDEGSAKEIRPAKLPEPPQMRERLAQEIVFFLESIRERARRQTGSDRVDLKRLEVSQDVVDYAYESSSSRPSTGASRLSLGEIRVTPCSSSRSLSRRTARSSQDATADEGRSLEEVKRMGEQLTYMRCDEVRNSLRQHLQEEIDQLKSDLEQLQESLATGGSSPYADSDTITMPRSREPTLLDLRTERQKLERVLLNSSMDQPALRRVPISSHGNQVVLASLHHHHSNKASVETIPVGAASLPTTPRVSSAQRLRSIVRESRIHEQQHAVSLHRLCGLQAELQQE